MRPHLRFWRPLFCLLNHAPKKETQANAVIPLRRTLLWRCGVSRGRHTFRPHFVFCVLDFGSHPTILILRMPVAHSCISWLAIQVLPLCTTGQSRVHYCCANRQSIARLSKPPAVCCVFVRGTPQLPLSGFLFSLARQVCCRAYPVKPHGEAASVPQTLRNTRSSPYRGDNLLRKVFKSAVHRAPFTTASLSRKVTYLYSP